MLQNAILAPVMLCHHLYMWKDAFPSSLKYLYNDISVFTCLWKNYLNMCDLKDDSAFGGYYKVMYLHQGNKESLTSWVVWLSE